MKVRADVRLEAAHLVIASAAVNDDSAPAYLLHRAFYGGFPEAFVRVVDVETAEITFGQAPIDPAQTADGRSVTWPSRAAGDPIAPGATLTLETRLPLPLAEPDVIHGPADAPTVESSVARLVLVFRYAVPPASWRPPARPGLRGLWDRLSQPGERPRPAPKGGFDVHGAEVRILTVAARLPQPITVRRSARRG